MNKKFILSLLIAAGFLLNACQKDLDVFVPDSGSLNGPDSTWYSTITASMPVSTLRTNLAITTYTDSIQVNSNVVTLSTPFGLQCTFPPNCCVGNAGQVITGTVNVELLLIKNKGDMIRMNRPTTSGDRLLVSGGELFIRLKKENNELHLAPNIKIQLKYADAPVNTQMRFFLGDESNPEKFNWLPLTDSANFVSPYSQGYTIFTNHLHWVNCDYFFDTSGIAPVTVSASLANYFTNANTLAFTVFKDLRATVAMYGNVATRKFNTPMLPAGKSITVVVISKQGNDYFLGYEKTTTATPTTGSNIQSVSITPVKRSLADILSYLNTL